jgi:hypothetical protein
MSDLIAMRHYSTRDISITKEGSITITIGAISVVTLTITVNFTSETVNNYYCKSYNYHSLLKKY